MSGPMISVDGMMYPEMQYVPYYPPPNTTVYVGNLSHQTTGTFQLILDEQIRFMFQTFGNIIDVKLQGEKGYAFVKLGDLM
jgi:RNA recognition motif-containing protein